MGKSEKKDKKTEKTVEKLEKKKDKSEMKKDKTEKKKEKKDKADKKKEKKDKSDKKKVKKDKSEKKKDKKEKKDKKRKHSESESEEEFVIHKKTKVEDPVEVKQPEKVETGWNDWNKASFNGDNAKKDKFLRLLGAKKNNNSGGLSQSFTPAKKSGGGLYGGLKSAIDEDEKHRITNDLEKQFDYGLQFKKQMQMGRRGGLGFN